MTPKIQDLTGFCAQLLSRAGMHVVRLAQDAAGDAHGLWSGHQRLLDTNSVYRAVVTSGAGFLGRQLDVESVVLAVVSALIRQRTRPSRPGFSDDWDHYPGPDDWPA